MMGGKAVAFSCLNLRQMISSSDRAMLIGNAVSEPFLGTKLFLAIRAQGLFAQFVFLLAC